MARAEQTGISADLTKAERIRKYGEVFTPDWMVAKMCDELERESPDAYEPRKTFLDPATGEGVFVLEVMRRKFARCKTRADYSAAIASVYAMDIQQRNVEATIRNVIALCGEYVRLTKKEIETISDHVILCDSLKVMRMMRDPQLADGAADWIDEGGRHGGEKTESGDANPP